MKKNVLLIVVFAILLFSSSCSYSNGESEQAVISNDYSMIVYNDRVYMPYCVDDISDKIVFQNSIIDAIVEKESFFENLFLTNYIYLSTDEQYIHLITDYDLNKSDYYKLKE